MRNFSHKSSTKFPIINVNNMSFPFIYGHKRGRDNNFNNEGWRRAAKRQVWLQGGARGSQGLHRNEKILKKRIRKNGQQFYSALDSFSTRSLHARSGHFIAPLKRWSDFSLLWGAGAPMPKSPPKKTALNHWQSDILSIFHFWLREGASLPLCNGTPHQERLANSVAVAIWKLKVISCFWSRIGQKIFTAPKARWNLYHYIKVFLSLLNFDTIHMKYYFNFS